jgi:hypothetical protein
VYTRFAKRSTALGSGHIPGSRRLPANVVSEGLAVSTAKQYSFFVRN